MKNGKYCAAVVGCGAISPLHIGGIADSGLAELVALCDKIPERAEKRRDELAPEARVFTDFDEMLETMPEIDVIHVCLPHYLHTPVAVKALMKGKNVFLEKPVGTTEEDIASLLKAEAESNGKLCVCFQNRFNDTTVLLDELVEKYGKVTACRAVVTWYRDEPYYTESGWRGTYATEGGGVMINQAIHTLDLMLHFCGAPSSLRATTANHHLKNVIEVEDTCEMRVRFAEGAIGNFYATTSYTKDASIFLELETEAGHTLSLFSGKIYDNGEPVPMATDSAAVRGKNCWGTGHSRLIGLYYQALQSGSPMPVTLESASTSLHVLLAAYRSQDSEILL